MGQPARSQSFNLMNAGGVLSCNSTYRLPIPGTTCATSAHVTTGSTIGVVGDARNEMMHEWIRQLGSTNAAQRNEAMGNLRKAGSHAVPLLVDTINKEDGRIRSKAIFLISQIGGTNACDALFNVYQSNQMLPNYDKAMIVTILDELCGARYVGFFVKELERQGDQDVQFALAIALAQRGEKSGVKHLLYRLENLDERRRNVAAWQLKKLFNQDFGNDVVRWREWLQQNNKM
jgi:hypothetical protein